MFIVTNILHIFLKSCLNVTICNEYCKKNNNLLNYYRGGGAVSTLGSRIRAVRGKRSQTEFGKILGVDRSTVALWESNRHQPGLDILLNISKMGNVDMDWLSCNEADTSYTNEILYSDPKWREFVSFAHEKSLTPKRLTQLVEASLNLDLPDDEQ